MQVKRSCSPDSAFCVLTILDDFCLSVCQPWVDALAICVLPLGVIEKTVCCQLQVFEIRKS